MGRKKFPRKRNKENAVECSSNGNSSVYGCCSERIMKIVEWIGQGEMCRSTNFVLCSHRKLIHLHFAQCNQLERMEKKSGNWLIKLALFPCCVAACWDKRHIHEGRPMTPNRWGSETMGKILGFLFGENKRKTKNVPDASCEGVQLSRRWSRRTSCRRKCHEHIDSQRHTNYNPMLIWHMSDIECGGSSCSSRRSGWQSLYLFPRSAQPDPLEHDLDLRVSQGGNLPKEFCTPGRVVSSQRLLAERSQTRTCTWRRWEDLVGLQVLPGIRQGVKMAHD